MPCAAFDGVTLTEWERQRHRGAARRHSRLPARGPSMATASASRWGGEGGPGARVDVLAAPSAVRGHISAGTVHHVAWRSADEPDQLAWRTAVAESGLYETSGPRPPVLPLDLLPRAGRVCCSRSPPARRASPATRRWRAWVRSSSCRPGSKPRASRSRRPCRPSRCGRRHERGRSPPGAAARPRRPAGRRGQGRRW